MTFLWVGLGGFLGAIARYATYLLIRSLFLTQFPLATLFINCIGCFLAGILTFSVERHGVIPERFVLIWSTGFLGAYTTFSAFGVETFSMMRSNQIEWVALNIVLQHILGIGAVWVGYLVASKLI